MWIVIPIFAAFVFLIIYAHNRSLCESYKTHTRGIINHDPDMRHFWYSVDLSEPQIIEALERCDVHTDLKYRFDAAVYTITFRTELPQGNPEVSYLLQITERDDHTLLKVSQTSHLLARHEFRMRQNEFWHQKLNAVPVPYL